MLTPRKLAAAVVSLVLLSAGQASAYCRSTTCTGDCPRDDDGCKTSGNKLFWKTSCIGFSVQKDGSSFIAMKYIEQVVQKSVVTWSDLECADGVATLAFSELDQVSCHKTEYNDGGTNANIILFQDTKWAYTSPDNTLAKTTATFDPDTGEILDADIEINHANNDFTINDEVVEYDLQSVLTHELGHFIGLDHTFDPDATMNASYVPGTIDQRTLEIDDIDAACAVYPPARQAKCDPQPKGGLGDQCGGDDPATDDGGDESGGCSAAGARPDDANFGMLGSIAALLSVWTLRSSRRRARPSK
jgi:hypothetical protein